MHLVHNQRGEPIHMSALQAIREDESGMSTAEYAVGTVAAAGLGGVLIKLLSSPEVQSLIWSVITKAFSWLV